MNIRPATKNDQDLIHELWTEFEAELPEPDYLRESWDDAWTDLAQTVREGVALIAEEEGRAVGFVFCVLGDRGRRTAHVTDTGMVGPRDSVLGVEKEIIVQRFLDGMPHRFEVAAGPVQFNSVLIDVDESTGRARSIDRVDRLWEA